jgi:hypothetical protein
MFAVVVIALVLVAMLYSGFFMHGDPIEQAVLHTPNLALVLA